MNLLSCFLASKNKNKPSPKPSSNISKCVKGYGHYDERAFEKAIYKSSWDQSWWIESEAYEKLLRDLGKVNKFSGRPSSCHVSDLISRLPKDMPANPGVRFPRGSGTLGTDDYAPLRFVRVPLACCQSLQSLVGSGTDANYFNILGSVVSTTNHTFDRDSFESTFGLVWTDAKGINKIN